MDKFGCEREADGMTKGEVITAEELMSVRFYMGDAQVVESGRFKGGPEAYNTINALLHPGTGNEKDKAMEGREIMLEDADHLKSYLQLILDIYSAMEKYRRAHLTEADEKQLTYRIDRAASLIRFEQDKHRIAGFFSTCKRGFLSEYAAAKAKIVLLEVQRDASVPYLDFEELFGDRYAKPEEAEILLPSGMIIENMEPVELSQQEQESFKDMNGNPPVGKWRLHLSMGQMPELAPETLDELYEKVTEPAVIEKVKAAMKLLTEGRSLSLEEEQFYCVWKLRLQYYIAGSIREKLSL